MDRRLGLLKQPRLDMQGDYRLLCGGSESVSESISQMIRTMQGTTVVMDINTNTPGAPPVASSVDCCLACMSNAKVLRSSLAFVKL